MGRSRSRLWLGARASPGQRTIRLRVAGARFVGQLAVGFEPDARCASFVGEVNLGLVADVLPITRAVLVDPGTSDFNLHRNRLACLAIGIRVDWSAGLRFARDSNGFPSMESLGRNAALSPESDRDGWFGRSELWWNSIEDTGAPWQMKSPRTHPRNPLGRKSGSTILGIARR